MQRSVYEKIRDGEIDANIVLKDDYITAFKHINPQAPVHIIIIPNRRIIGMNDIDENDNVYLAMLLLAAKNIAKQQKISETGYRVIINSGTNAGEQIDYLNIQLLGGKCLS